MELYFAGGHSAAAVAEMLGRTKKQVRDQALRIQTRFPQARQLRFPELRGFGQPRESISVMRDHGIAPVRANVTGAGMKYWRRT